MELQRPFRLITPTLDGDVLAVLALAEASFTVGQLRRMLDASDEGIRKVLRRLVGQGIVSTQVHGPVSTYELNREHLAAQPIIAIAQLRSTFLDRLERAFSAWGIPPKYAAVFGSAGRGQMTTSSDIDILLIRPDRCDEELWDEQVLELTHQVARWTGNDVRPLEYTVSELEEAREPVLEDVAREGLTVFGQPAWFRRRVKKRNN
jgi:predicted nucleotidyltransferase